MIWEKCGHIYKPDGALQWSQSHAQIPTPMVLPNNNLRIYFSTRDEKNRSQPTFIDVDGSDFTKIVKINPQRLWQFGRPGTFDDNGIMPASWVKHPDRDEIYMYYVGWNACTTVAYQLSTGLAISHDGGDTFVEYAEGSILDRNLDDPIFATIPCVLIENGTWRAWYISCTHWQEINGRMEPNYLIKYAESKNGIHWQRYKDPCIHYSFEGEALGRPWVIKENNHYHMWYSQRGSLNYRERNGQPYKIGYARSKDGLIWERLDEASGIERSATSWDSEMMCYCSVFTHNSQQYMLYNGNGFGKAGFGYAKKNGNFSLNGNSTPLSHIVPENNL